MSSRTDRPGRDLEIGGYFGLEPAAKKPDGGPIHLGPNPARLNSGRNCLRAVLVRSQARRIHLPDYICAAVVDAVRACGVTPVFYRIDDQLQTRDDVAMEATDLFLRVNYFGLQVRAAEQAVPGLVIDNCQAFHAAPLEGAVNIYSPRKFFGVPDGGYLVGAAAGYWPPDESRNGLSHLQTRSREGARAGYAAYQVHEQAFAWRPVRTMSARTRQILGGIDFGAAARQRQANYRQLNAALGQENALQAAVEALPDAAPLAYPFLSTVPDLKADLNRRGIFAAAYWPDCLQRPECGSGARYLARNLTALPVDQRYGAEEMDIIIGAVKAHLAAQTVRMVVA